MENKINIAEILKDCPKGMELYSPLCGECKLYDVNDYNIRIEASNKDTLICLYHDGRYCANGEIMLFPKGKTTWEGFVPPCQFNDGDVIYTDSFIAIFSDITESGAVYYHCYYHIHTKRFKAEHDCGIGNINYDEFRIATADEKAKLFQAIKDNGYKWNPETKTLEKVPKIKDGDIIYTKTSLSEWVSIFEKFDDDECKCYIDYCIDSDTYYGKIGGKKNPLCDIDEIVEQRLATEEEKQKLFDVIKEHGHRWNIETKTLEELIKPKFKVGDRIKHIVGREEVATVVSVEDLHYNLDSKVGTSSFSISLQREWELVPNKFDITTLKPFESKVLVRDYDYQYWRVSFFGYFDKFMGKFDTVRGVCIQCIPYEGNEHLLGTTNDCIDFYKTWE